MSEEKRETEGGVRPDWAPSEGGDAFAITIRPGVASPQRTDPGRPSRVVRRRELGLDEMVEGVLRGDRSVLGQAITLIESNAPRHHQPARDLLARLLPHAGHAVRIGITGVPGAGKSTLIERWGLHLLEQGHRVAVLAVDPSSTISGGSILGDKTRMEDLSRSPGCFIRPSPSGGTLGGVTRKSRETIVLCEAAGFDVILVETVGVGQNEVTVRDMVDFFLLLLLSGAGDELQGIKKGVVEMADALVVHKADGDNLMRARAAQAEYAMALHYLSHPTRGWQSRVHLCSSRSGLGIPELWAMVRGFRERTQQNGAWEERRQEQAVRWLEGLVQEYLMLTFRQNGAVQAQWPELRQEVRRGQLLATDGAERLLKAFLGQADLRLGDLLS